MKKVLITGFSGQDGYLMTKYLLENTDNTLIIGLRRVVRGKVEDPDNLLSNKRVVSVDLDICDSINTERIVKIYQPDYFINFAANSFVGNSWDMPVNHFETNTLAVLYQLEAIKKYCPNCHYYSSGSSEQFGNVEYSPQDINHPFRPRSPYGASKCSAHHIVKVYRESYGLYAVQGLLFNHEGIRRGHEFVTRKISRETARFKKELVKGKIPKPIELGNLDAKRDWSDAEDFMDGVWKMLNQEKPKDYVLSSGETHSIREFVNEAFKTVKINLSWIGEEEKTNAVTFNHNMLIRGPINVIKVNPEFYRPAEVNLLLGDSTPAREELGWQPKTNFKQLVKKMVENDLKRYE